MCNGCGSSGGGAKLLRKKTKKSSIVFGAKGTTPIDYTAGKPYQYRGGITGRLYVWRKPWAENIDVRDAPALIKHIGADSLSGPAIDEYNAAKEARKATRAKRAKKRAMENVVDSDQDDAGA